MHTHICYSAMKNKELLLFSIFDNMDGPLEGIMLSEIGRAEKAKYHMILHVRGIQKKTRNQSQKERSDVWLPEARLKRG